MNKLLINLCLCVVIHRGVPIKKANKDVAQRNAVIIKLTKELKLIKEIRRELKVRPSTKYQATRN